jgi:hypothetical protein
MAHSLSVGVYSFQFTFHIFLGQDQSFADLYVTDVTLQTRLVDNPLCNYVCVRTDDEMTFTLAMLEKYRYSLLRAKHPQLVNYLRLAVPKRKLANFKRIAAEHKLHIACIDSQNEVNDCLNDYHTERIRLQQEGERQYQEEQELLRKQCQEEDRKGE